jgi:hypothetical protein
MIKIIIITITLLLFVQFVLYYCNVDLFKMYIKEDTNNSSIELEESKEQLKAFINELKQYDNII